MSGKLPGNLWRTIYDIQGEAQQAAEGDRPCRSIEDTWARLEKVLPPPYPTTPDMHTLLKRIRKMLSDERRSHPLGLGPDARTGWIDEIDGVIGPERGEDG